MEICGSTKDEFVSSTACLGEDVDEAGAFSIYSHSSNISQPSIGDIVAFGIFHSQIAGIGPGRDLGGFAPAALVFLGQQGIAHVAVYLLLTAAVLQEHILHHAALLGSEREQFFAVVIVVEQKEYAVFAHVVGA